MGLVLKAQHRRMKRIVALKVLSPSVTKSAHTLRRFQREVEAAARLCHANIVTAFDAGVHEGMHYLVMEYVCGKDLAAIVKAEGLLSPEQAIDYLLQTARGLEHAHKLGIVHRDIKPGNLLLDEHGQIKILDMGLARLDQGGKRSAEENITRTGTIMGTVDYMAPEQAMNTRHADHRADIYSLGCTLYFLLNGAPPYAGETMMERLVAHRELPIPSLTALRDDVPLELDRIFQRLMAKYADQRYQSIEELIDDLALAQEQGQRPELRAPQAVPSTDDPDLLTFLDSLEPQSASSKFRGPPPSSDTIDDRPGAITAAGADISTEFSVTPSHSSVTIAVPRRWASPLLVGGIAAAAASVLMIGVTLLWLRIGRAEEATMVNSSPTASPPICEG
jgi:serine/threonine protein kinase